ncbi:MAG: glutamate racemase [Oscillospiraceae bacterium]|nr:glutamate racemase [Oscillospiraceae bacterium]
MDNRAIGVFDSGLGGLTAAQALRGLLPDERILYLADSYNMPYGEKNRARIVEMSRMDLRFLLEKGVKAVFIACGTATSNALEILEKESPVPVFGIVGPAAGKAAAATVNGRIGLLATRASVRAGSYQRAIRALDPRLAVTAQACPRFATMVEDGIFEKDDEKVLAAAAEYLPPLKQTEVDTVILGCTHYPLLADVIGEYMGAGVKLISAGAAAAERLAAFLGANGLLNSSGGHGGTEYYTTGAPEAFARTAELMLRQDVRGKLTGLEPFDKAGNM